MDADRSCSKTYVDEDSVHVVFPALDHSSIVFFCVCEAEIPHFQGGDVTARVSRSYSSRVDVNEMSEKKRGD